MKVLGIETSCDDTGVALYDTERGLRAHALHSQTEVHRAYGGVVPELASRDHIRRVLPLVRRVLAQAECALCDLDAIAYTAGPGLAGALLVGASIACGLARALQIPAIGVHHLEGHLLSPMLASPRPQFPFVALLVSGGHTQLIEVAAVGHYRLLGETLDDAAGEAFDKTAKLLGLGYPGGPALARLAEGGTSGRFRLPRPMLASGDLNFSFSGLKTAALLLAQAQGNDEGARADIARAFEEAVVEVLVEKSTQAVLATGHGQLVVAGGVGANRRLREVLNQRAREAGFRVFYPPVELCTDNGAMIAYAGAMHRAQAMPASGYRYTVFPRWDLALPGPEATRSRRRTARSTARH